MSANQKDLILYQVGKRKGKLESKEYKVFYEKVRSCISDIQNPNKSPRDRLKRLYDYGSLDTKISSQQEMEWYINQIGKEIRHIERCERHGLWQGIQEGNDRLDNFFEQCLRLISPRPLDIPLDDEEEEKTRPSGSGNIGEF